MKVKVMRDALLEGLKAALPAVVKESKALALLQSVRLSQDGERLKAEGCTIDQCGWMRVECETIEAAEPVAVNAAHLMRFVKSMEPGVIELETKKGSLIIQGGQARFSLQLNDASSWPEFLWPEAKTAIEIDSAALQELIKKTKFAILTDGTRSILMGLRLELKGETLEAQATNGTMVAVARYAIPGGTQTGGATVPMAAVEMMEALLKSQEGTVKLGFDGERIMMASAGEEIWRWGSRLLENSWPNVMRVIPTERQNVAKVGREELAAALRRVMLAVLIDNPSVTLQADAGAITLKGKSATMNAKEEVACKYDGEAVTVAADPGKIRPFLECTDLDYVELGLFDGTRVVTVGFPGLDYIGGFMPQRAK